MILASRVGHPLRFWSAILLVPMVLSGCSIHAHSPTLSLYGSFFPVWLMAALLGVICTVVLRLLFIRAGLHEHLPMPPLTYLCAAIFSGIMIWAFWTGVLAL
jgi:hypothetical protein